MADRNTVLVEGSPFRAGMRVRMTQTVGRIKRGMSGKIIGLASRTVDLGNVWAIEFDFPIMFVQSHEPNIIMIELINEMLFEKSP